MLHGVAAKRGAKIEYISESSGPQHSLSWDVVVLGKLLVRFIDGFELIICS